MSHVFDPELPVEEAVTLPAAWYTEEAIFRAERAALFKLNWQVVGRTGQLSKPGDYITAHVAGEPIVVIVGDDGSLGAFFNVCRHHAAEVAHGEGCVERLTCPYHGWTYGRDGGLLKAPRLGPARDFKREAFGLVRMPVETWGPFVLVQPHVSDAPVRMSMGIRHPELTKALDETGWERLTFVGRRQYGVACNWKVFVDNYLDGGYHVEGLHPALADQLDLSSYQTHMYDHSVNQTCRSRRQEPSSEAASDRLGSDTIYGWFYPNLMLNRYGPFLDANIVVPLSPNRTEVIFDYFCDPGTAEDDAFIQESLAASDQVQQEDIHICESVQRGLESSSYDTGRYAPHLEMGAYAFHRWLARDLPSIRR